MATEYLKALHQSCQIKLQPLACLSTTTKKQFGLSFEGQNYKHGTFVDKNICVFRFKMLLSNKEGRLISMIAPCLQDWLLGKFS